MADKLMSTPIPVLTEEDRRLAYGCLARHAATDLAEMLGVEEPKK